MLNFVLPGVALFVVTLLFLPAVRKRTLWRAVVTPLASIIGSGFLISGPLLAHVASAWAPLAMLAILVLAFAIGGVIRFNILHAEPVLQDPHANKIVFSLQRVSDLALGFAYIVSVAFYLRLLASFVLDFGGYGDELTESIFTTLVLLFIAIVGWQRGLNGLEKMEESAVAVKLSIIAAFLIGLVAFDWQFLVSSDSWPAVTTDLGVAETVRVMAGMLLIVQGFETSRYLGDQYDPKMRVRSMRLAQLIASVVYMLFMILGLPLLMQYQGDVNETAIIAVAGHVAAILAPMLVLAAVMSQFSAAIADTVGAGGVISDISGRRISTRMGYIYLVLLAVALVWTSDVFEIISLASRVFAFYYLLQCLIAISVCLQRSEASTANTKRRMLGLILLSAVLLLVVIFAVPVD